MGMVRVVMKAQRRLRKWVPFSLSPRKKDASKTTQKILTLNPTTKNARPHPPSLATSFAKLKFKSLDQEFTVDPLFKKTSADFDEGGAGGILMNHLGCDESMKVVFDAGDARLVDDEEDLGGVENDDDEKDLQKVEVGRLIS